MEAEDSKMITDAAANQQIQSSTGRNNFLDSFREDCLDRHLSEETIRRYLSSIQIFMQFIEANNNTSLEQVDRHVLKEFIHYRKGFTGRHGPIDMKTLENDFSALSAFYEFLTFEGYAQANPILAVRKRYLTRYKDNEDEESPRKLISVDEMALLINSILSIRDKAIVTVLGKTGVRRGELIAIDIGDIDWERQSITLKRKQFKKRSNRVVFFDDETARGLRRWMSVRSKYHSKDNALFIGEHGLRLNRNGIASMIAKHAARVGLHNPISNRVEDHFSAHCCRHWFTTHLRRAGMDREFIKVLRGDQRRESIAVYDHVDLEEVRKAYLAFIPQLGI